MMIFMHEEAHDSYMEDLTFKLKFWAITELCEL